MSLPAADDLFRPTANPADDTAETTSDGQSTPEEEPQSRQDGHGRGVRHRPSGRVRHDEKMTVYVTADELLDIEHARLLLRRDHGLAVDRGRLVREAVALVLADLEAEAGDSALVRRLKQA